MVYVIQVCWQLASKSPEHQIWLYHIFPHHHKHMICGKKVLNIKYVFWFCLQLLLETFLILRRIQQDIIIHLHRSSCKVPVILSYFNQKWIFSMNFKKSLEYQISLKSVQWDPNCSMQIDGWADMTKLMATFHNSANKSKNWDASTTTAVTENLYWNWLLKNANSLHFIYSKLENNMSRKTMLILWRSKWHMTFGITGYVNMSTKFARTFRNAHNLK